MNSQNVSSLGNDDEEINRLKKEISLTKSDSIKSINHLKISGLYFKNGEINNYKFHLQRGKLFSKNNAFLKAYVAYNEALNHLNNGNFDQFYNEISKLLPQLKKFNNSTSSHLQLLIVQNISIYHTINLNYDLSIQILMNEGIPLAKKAKNYTALGTHYESIADSFYELNDFTKSAKYYELAIESYKKENEKSIDLLSICYIYYSNCLTQLEDFVAAKKILNKAFDILKKHEDNNLYPLYYNALGEWNLKQKRYAVAIENFKKGLKIISNSQEINEESETFLSLTLNLAESKYETQDYNESIELLNNLTLDTEDHNKLFIYKLFNSNFQKLGEYDKANSYLEKYISLKDSLDNAIKERDYRKIEAKYNSLEKEKKIIQLEKEKTEKEIRLKNLRLWYGFVSITLLIALILFYFLYKNYKNQKRINRQKDIIHEQNIEFLNSQKEIEIMQAMINGEEAERKRIARDLHDGIGSRLSSLKMQLNQLESKKINTQEFESISEGLTKSITDLRRTAFNLVPETLSKLGLELALKDLCFSMSNNNVSILFTSYEIQENIIESNQITIFRIVQELINNALKHSNCTEIIVDCSQNDELFLITIEDNGIGFNTNDLECFSGLGLKNIKSRVELLKGKLDVVSNSCKGTIFNIELNVQFDHPKNM